MTSILHADADPFRCPKCDGQAIPAQECRQCGAWWEDYGYPTSMASFMPAGDLLAKTAMLSGRLHEGFTLLDVGGGSGIAGWHLWELSRPSRVVVVDKFGYSAQPEYVTSFFEDDGLNVVERFGPRSFDIVISTEVLEHLPKEHGERFLSGLASVARMFVGISTPNGYQEHGWRLAPDGRDNPYQEHLCGWHVEELMSLGWKCHCNGIHEQRKLAGFQNVAYKYGA